MPDNVDVLLARELDARIPRSGGWSEESLWQNILRAEVNASCLHRENIDEAINKAVAGIRARHSLASFRSFDRPESDYRSELRSFQTPMNVEIPKNMIAVIRAERDRRQARLDEIEPPDYAYDHWLFTDEPFINELCLVLLVAIRHQVERELMRLGARVSSSTAPIEGEEYRDRLLQQRKELRTSKGWKELAAKLVLNAYPEWDSSMETLRLLVNCYKHDPLEGPDSQLLRHLKLDEAVKYASLPESGCLREGLALSLQLAKEADYCDVTEELLSRAERFVTEVAQQPFIASVKPGRISFSPDDFVC